MFRNVFYALFLNHEMQFVLITVLMFSILFDNYAVILYLLLYLLRTSLIISFFLFCSVFLFNLFDYRNYKRNYTLLSFSLMRTFCLI